MLELSGATARARDDRRRRRGPAAEDDPPPRRPDHEPARRRDPARKVRRDPERARVHDASAPRRPRRDRAGVPARRRHARGRPDRGGRAARRARQAAGDAALAPRRLGPADRAAAASPPRADALAAQGLHEIVGWSFAHPDLADRLRLGADHPLPAHGDARQPALDRPVACCARRCSARCSTSPGTIAPAAPRRCALFEAGAVYLPTEAGQLPREPHHIGAVLTGDVRPASWRDGHPPAVDFFAVKGVLEGLMDALRADWRLEARARAVPASGPLGQHPRRRRAGRLDRRDPSAGRGAMGPARHRGRVRARPRRRARAGDHAVPRGERVPRRARGHRRRRPRARDRGSAARARTPRRRPAARRRRGVRRVSRSRAARRGQRVAGAGAHLPGRRTGR